MLKSLTSFLLKYKQLIFWLIIISVVIYLILPDKSDIQESLEILKSADLKWFLIANIFYYLTIPMYSIQIVVLAMHKLNSWVAYKVQMSVLFINKLLPSSISSFTMNSFYLHKNEHTPSQIASVITMKALTSSITYTLLFFVSIFFAITRLDIVEKISSSFDLEKILTHLIVLIILSIISIFILYRIPKFKLSINKAIKSFWDKFKDYKQRPKDIAVAIATGFLAPTIGVFVLMASAKSVGLEISYLQSFVIYTLGTTMANLIPTPGGMGGAEAGLYAGFTMLGFNSSEALAATLMYRMISFWIPFIPGTIFFANLRKDVLKDFSINWKMGKSKNLSKSK